MIKERLNFMKKLVPTSLNVAHSFYEEKTLGHFLTYLGLKDFFNSNFP